MTLASAMATSAAAVDPHSATAGRGVTRGSLVSILLATLGSAPRARRAQPRPTAGVARERRLPANLLDPGISAALLGELTESARWVTLADGGDFDDLGVYELLRRRAGRHRRRRRHRGRRLHVRGARHAGGAGARATSASRSRSTAWSACGPASRPAIRPRRAHALGRVGLSRPRRTAGGRGRARLPEGDEAGRRADRRRRARAGCIPRSRTSAPWISSSTRARSTRTGCSVESPRRACWTTRPWPAPCLDRGAPC